MTQYMFALFGGGFVLMIGYIVWAGGLFESRPTDHSRYLVGELPPGWIFAKEFVRAEGSIGEFLLPGGAKVSVVVTDTTVTDIEPLLGCARRFQVEGGFDHEECRGVPELPVRYLTAHVELWSSSPLTPEGGVPQFAMRREGYFLIRPAEGQFRGIQVWRKYREPLGNHDLVGSGAKSYS